MQVMECGDCGCALPAGARHCPGCVRQEERERKQREQWHDYQDELAEYAGVGPGDDEP